MVQVPTRSIFLRGLIVFRGQDLWPVSKARVEQTIRQVHRMSLNLQGTSQRCYSLCYVRTFQLRSLLRDVMFAQRSFLPKTWSVAVAKMSALPE